VQRPAPALLPQPRRLALDPSRRVEVGVPIERVRAQTAPQGYRLTIDVGGTARAEAADEAGWFYAQCTLDQLRAIGPSGLVPVGVVEDWPDLPVRAVMLDVSRGKVPTLDTLYGIVDRLSSWKLNQLQLYIEHTFAYPGHETVWAGADPFDAEDLDRLSEYCAARHVELVPNQNALGHMERWLLHERYASLGISHGVVRGPLGMPMAPSTLDPANPEAFALVEELLGTQCATVPSRFLHVGLDEPWDLPRARSGEWSTWLGRLRALSTAADRTLLVWGDMPAAHPELLGELPERVTVCEWGYEANHPFAERARALAGHGVEHWLCPGTSSWLSLVGRSSNSLENCASAAQAAAESGATGMLVTDWGDMGHLQHLPVSDLGFAAAAALSWCRQTNGGGVEAYADLLDRLCYGDGSGTLGTALVRLGDLHRLVPLQVPNISTLVLPLYFPQLPVGAELDPGLTPWHLHAVMDGIDDALGTLVRARPATAHGRLAVDELVASAELLRLCCLDAEARLGAGGRLAGLAAPVRAKLAARLDELVDTHRRRWTARNRPGGLDESCAWLEHLRRCYSTGEAPDDWAGPVVERARRGPGAQR
jgi:hypothetical protein